MTERQWMAAFGTDAALFRGDFSGRQMFLAPARMDRARAVLASDPWPPPDTWLAPHAPASATTVRAWVLAQAAMIDEADPAPVLRQAVALIAPTRPFYALYEVAVAWAEDLVSAAQARAIVADLGLPDVPDLILGIPDRIQDMAAQRNGWGMPDLGRSMRAELTRSLRRRIRPFLQYLADRDIPFGRALIHRCTNGVIPLFFALRVAAALVVPVAKAKAFSVSVCQGLCDRFGNQPAVETLITCVEEGDLSEAQARIIADEAGLTYG